MDVLARLLEASPELGQPSIMFNQQTDFSLMYELSTVTCVNTGFDNKVSTHQPRVFFHFEHLVSAGFIDKAAFERANKAIVVAWPGIVELEKQRAAKTSTTQAFVAMWFDPSTDDALAEWISNLVGAAGYQAFRIDRSHHANRIDDEIIAQIRRSRFSHR